MDDFQRLPDCPGNPQAIQKHTYQKKTIVYESKYVAHDFILIVLPLGIAYWLLSFRWAKGPGAERLGFGSGGRRSRAGPAWFWLGGAKGPGPDRLGFGLGGQGSWAGPAWLWLGGQGSWAGPAWFWLGGEPGWWGGGGGRCNFMYVYDNFSLAN